MKCCQIRRRFREFLELYQQLKANGHKSMLSFVFPPRRSIWQSRTSVVDTRMVSFRHFLAELISLNPIPIQVLVFLDISSHIKGTLNLESSNAYNIEAEAHTC